MRGGVVRPDYENMTTKELLARLQRTRVRPFDENLQPRPLSPEELQEVQDLKTVLATREHVPNKPERKLARQKAAAERRGQSKARNR